jgi:hypothetical protein
MHPLKTLLEDIANIIDFGRVCFFLGKELYIHYIAEDDGTNDTENN